MAVYFKEWVVVETVQDIQRGIATLIYQNNVLAEGKTVVSRCRSAHTIQEDDGYVMEGNGDRRYIRTPTEVSSGWGRLRKAMATAEHGAWFSASVEVTTEGTYSFSFDYDNEPEWSIRPLKDTLLDDLQRHPRPVSEIPSWHPASPDYVEGSYNN